MFKYSHQKLFIVLLFAAQLYSCSPEKQSIKYIDVVKVFNDFNLSKELKAKTQEMASAFDSRIDSLELVLNTTDRSNEAYSLNVRKYNETISKKENLVNAEIEKSDQRIWKLLNTYFKEFGQNEDIEILMGGNGSGNVLFVQTQSDLTDRFLQYANAKYEGE